MVHKHTIQDLENLISEKLAGEGCKAYSNICKLMQTEEGKTRIKARVKEMVLDDGIDNIDAALAQVESELIFDTGN